MRRKNCCRSFTMNCVELPLPVGMNFEETAAALGIAVPTAKQWWTYARAWLTVEMRDSSSH